MQRRHGGNYNANATEDTVRSKDPATPAREQDGTGVVISGDADGDGVCDQNEIVGCRDPTARNYNTHATDPADCILPVCDVCLEEKDGTGTLDDRDRDDDGI